MCQVQPGTPLNISTQHTTTMNTQFHTPPNISTQHTPSTNNQNQQNTPTYKPTKLLMSLINVCGVKTRMKSVEFYNFINNYDVILMTETKLDELDQIAFPGFKLITENRLFKRKASGGVAALISEKVQSRVSLINNTQQDSLWLKFKGSN